jgi:CubicO group peptidase (beta-lactamase class C family)
MRPGDPPLAGIAEPRFAPVREAFAALLADGQETGAALAVVHDGRPAVDLYGGWRDAAQRRAWLPRTLVNVFSVGKPLAALAALLLVERGRIGLDDSVARHWPEFAASGKAPATVRHALSHTAGVPVFPVRRDTTAYANWHLLAADLAGAAPLWTPGTVAAEHALTYGHLVGELVRRVDGRSLGRFLADELTGPWDLDLAFGLDAASARRTAELEYGDPTWPATTLGEPGSLRARALGNPAGCLDLAVLNGDAWRAAEVPAVNLHATATALARLYANLLGGGAGLLDAGLVRELTTTQFDGWDQLLQRRVQWTLGLQADDDGTWGMGGIGGSVGFADPVRGYAFAYVTRRLSDHHRVDILVDALHGCL